MLHHLAQPVLPKQNLAVQIKVNLTSYSTRWTTLLCSSIVCQTIVPKSTNVMFQWSLSNPAFVCVQGRVIERHSAVDAPDGAVPAAVVAEGDEADDVTVDDDGRRKK